ncbi:unnamed protein product [Protopolystoma xenopodis]|uniref:Uncharacterized protein n=1 Tax=Protopolystoma xenopodis TaxID=117903 RepID=A0A3S5BMN4_9PLAT|nr:unnamed protein product [Protopolystoma xenopodis]
MQKQAQPTDPGLLVVHFSYTPPTCPTLSPQPTVNGRSCLIFYMRPHRDKSVYRFMCLLNPPVYTPQPATE